MAAWCTRSDDASSRLCLEQDVARLEPASSSQATPTALVPCQLQAEAAKARFTQISGAQAKAEGAVGRTHFCGAWWRNGFHEDGVWSALRVAEALGAHEADD